MSHNVTHEEIVKRFIESKAIDFNALGRFVTEIAPSLTSDKGLHGVLIGRYSIIACMLNPIDAGGLVGHLRTSELASAMLEQEPVASVR